MKKYTPSVKNNNALRDEVATELKAFVYRLEKGKYNDDLDSDVVSGITLQLKSLTESFENVICTGEENIGLLAEQAISQIKALAKQADQKMMHRFESAADELIYTIGLWKDVINGVVVMGTPEDIEKEKVSRSRKKLEARLKELSDLKQSFVENDKRLEKELSTLENDLATYESSMLKEDNERKINDLYRSIKATKSKIDMLTVRHGNYSACYNLLDMIYSNAAEILQATDFVAEEIGKAKALLNIEKLKRVVVDPDRAIAILKRMDAEIKEIARRTGSLDSRVFGLDSGAATVSDDAMKYKEELMRKKREKEALAASNDGIETPAKPKTKIDTED
ncbi:MAG: hypothetical protein J1F33_07510 [Clostridiales bacterium]|nr:hypothetical protein [Clostridiales bacterium]